MKTGRANPIEDLLRPLKQKKTMEVYKNNNAEDKAKLFTSLRQLDLAPQIKKQMAEWMFSGASKEDVKKDIQGVLDGGYKTPAVSPENANGHSNIQGQQEGVSAPQRCARPASVAFPSGCENVVTGDQSFCSECGYPVKITLTVCLQCSTQLQSTDKFCGTCGLQQRSPSSTLPTMDATQLSQLTQALGKDDKSGKNAHALATEKSRKKAVQKLREMEPPSSAPDGQAVHMDLLLTHLTRSASKKATATHHPFDICRLKIHLTGYVLDHSVTLNWSPNGLQLFMFEEILDRSKREYVHDTALPTAAKRLEKKIYSMQAGSLSTVRDNLTQLALWAEVVWSPALSRAVTVIRDDVETLYQEESTPGRIWNATFVVKAIDTMMEDWSKQSADFQAGISDYSTLHPDTQFFSNVPGSAAYIPMPYLRHQSADGTMQLNPVVKALVTEFEEDIRRKVEAAALEPRLVMPQPKQPRKQQTPSQNKAAGFGGYKASLYQTQHQVVPFEDISDILRDAHRAVAGMDTRVCLDYNSNANCRFSDTVCQRDHSKFTAAQLKDAPAIAIVLENLGGIAGQTKKSATAIQSMVDTYRKSVGTLEDGAVGCSSHLKSNGSTVMPYDLNSLTDFPVADMGAQSLKNGMNGPRATASTRFPVPDLHCVTPAHRQDMARKSSVAPDVSILKNGVIVTKQSWLEHSVDLGAVPSTASRSLTVQYRSHELSPGLKLSFKNYETGDTLIDGTGRSLQQTCMFNSVAAALGGAQSSSQLHGDMMKQAHHLRNHRLQLESAHVANIMARNVMDGGLQHFNALRFMCPASLMDKVLVIYHRTVTSHLKVQVLVGSKAHANSRVAWVWGEKQHATPLTLSEASLILADDVQKSLRSDNDLTLDAFFSHCLPQLRSNTDVAVNLAFNAFEDWGQMMQVAGDELLFGASLDTNLFDVLQYMTEDESMNVADQWFGLQPPAAIDFPIVTHNDLLSAADIYYQAVAMADESVSNLPPLGEEQLQILANAARTFNSMVQMTDMPDEEWLPLFLDANADMARAVADLPSGGLEYIVRFLRSEHPYRANAWHDAVRSLPLFSSVLNSDHMSFLANAMVDGVNMHADTSSLPKRGPMPASVLARKNPEKVMSGHVKHMRQGRMLVFRKTDKHLWKNLGIIFSGLSWVDEDPVNKPDGRSCINASAPLNNSVNDVTNRENLPWEHYATLETVVTEWVSHMQSLADELQMDIDEHTWTLVKLDIEKAFMKISIRPADVGKLAYAFKQYVFVMMVLPFGWAGSSFCFDPFTSAICTLHNASEPAVDTLSHTDGDLPRYESALLGTPGTIPLTTVPTGTFCSEKFVDDMFSMDTLFSDRAQLSFAWLVYITRQLMGHHSISDKKILQEGCLATRQAILGVAGDVANYALTMIHDKVEESLVMLQSRELADDQVWFPLQVFQKAHSKLRWNCSLSRVLKGYLSGFIRGLQGVRSDAPSHTLVTPARENEDVQVAAKKFHLDKQFLILCFQQALEKPYLMSASFIQMLPTDTLIQMSTVIKLRGDMSPGAGSAMNDNLMEFFVVPWISEIRDLYQQSLISGSDKSLTSLVTAAILETTMAIAAQMKWDHAWSMCVASYAIDNSNGEGWINSLFAGSDIAQVIMRYCGVRQFLGQYRMVATPVRTDDEEQKWPDNVSRWFNADGSISQEHMDAFFADDVSNRYVQVDPPELLADLQRWMVHSWKSPTLPLLQQLLPLLFKEPDLPPSMQVFGFKQKQSPQQDVTFAEICQLNETNRRPSFTATVGFVGGGGDAMAIVLNAGKVLVSWDSDESCHKAVQAFTGVKPLGDFMSMDFSTLPDTDLYSGGAPCQAFTVMGKQLGTQDQRGLLWPRQLALFKVKQYPVIVLENVPGIMVVQSGANFRVMLQGLKDMGYTVFHGLFQMWRYNSPTNRIRLFIVAFHPSVSAAAQHFTWPQPWVQCPLPVSAWRIPPSQAATRHVRARPADETQTALKLAAIIGKGGANVPGRSNWVFSDQGVAATLLASGQTHSYVTPADYQRWLLQRESDPQALLQCSNLTAADCVTAANWPKDYPFQPGDQAVFKAVNNGWPLDFGRALFCQINKAWQYHKNSSFRYGRLCGSTDAALGTALASYTSYEHLPDFLTTTQVLRAAGIDSLSNTMKTAAEVGQTTPYSGPLYPTRGNVRAEFQAAHAGKLDGFTAAHVDNMVGFSAAAFSSLHVDTTDQRYVNIWNKEWVPFCTRLGLDTPFLGLRSDPRSSEDVLILWCLEECGNRALQADTFWKKLYAINYFHKLMRLGDVLTDVPYLRLLLRAIAMYRPAGTNRKSPVLPSMLRALREFVLDMSVPWQVTAWRGILFAYRLLCRSQEAFACLDMGAFDLSKVVRVCDVAFYRQGARLTRLSDYHLANELEVTFNVQKNDRSGASQVRSVFADDDPEYCPVFQTARHVQSRPDAPPQQALFAWGVGVNRPGEGLRRCDVAALLKQAAQLCDLPEAKFATHSLRRGGAHSLRMASCTMEEIAIFGRWRSGPDGCVKVYVLEHGDIFEAGRKVQFQRGAPRDAAGRVREARPFRQRS